MKLSFLDTIGKRLGASFGLVLCLLVAVAGAASVALMQARSLSERMVDVVLPAMKAIDEVEAAHLNISVLVRDVVSNDDRSVQTKTRNELAEQEKRLVLALVSLKDFVAVQEYAEAQRALSQLLEERDKADATVERALDLADHGQYHKAELIVYNELRPSQARMSDQLVAVRSTFRGQSIEAAKTAAERNARSVALILTITLIAVGIGLVASIWIPRLITRPIAIAVATAERVAAGDLDDRISGGSGDETGRLLDALERMRDGLVGAVGTIRHSAESVSSASQQIAMGNAELSTRTEEQSSSLEETASSIEELTAAVKLNADNAKEANTLAQRASSVAEGGGKAMGEAVESMSGIRDASNKIAEIVGVIDGIAFQTNILALNAAVEAARVGAQGRGFAVVASEVRSLAQRCAVSAKDIKELIRSSTDTVDAGAKLIDGAGKTMQEIVRSIRRVSAITAEIATASEEQRSGIEQVSKAVAQMEQITQQNAALVEESAAAAENMSAQAVQLVEAVSRFDLGEGAAPAPARAPRLSAPAEWEKF